MVTHHGKAGIVAALFVTLVTAHLAAQTAWAPTGELNSRAGTACAHDVARGATILFGGYDGRRRDDTWRWDGTAWTRLEPAHRPSPRRDHSMVYDSLRQRILLFGGNGQWTLQDLWSWDGTDWSLVPVATPPSVGQYHGMAYDVVRDRVVLLSGQVTNQVAVWEFDGIDWLARTATPTNWPRWTDTNTLVAYDHVAGRTAYFESIASSAKMWRWDGAVWTSQNAVPLSGLSRSIMVNDPVRDRMLMIPGTYAAPGATTIYQYNTTTTMWQGLTNTGPLSIGQSACFDTTRDRLVFVGGNVPLASADSSVWEWNGTQWERRSYAPPSARSETGVTYDTIHDRVLVYGGDGDSTLGDTWLCDQGRWQLTIPEPQFSGSTHPGDLRGHVLVHDAARDQFLLMGGATGSFAFWRLVANQWQRIQVATPPQVQWPGVVYDSRRQRAVLFGGAQNNQNTNAMWSWDGVAWTQLSSVTMPPPRSKPGIAYDPLRDRIVLFGGVGASINDTWEYDGVDWELRAATSMVSLLEVREVAYDLVREVTVATGTPYQGVFETWQWDGTDWTRIAVGNPMPLRAGNALVGTHRGLLTIGGLESGSYVSEVQLLSTSAPATLAAFGASGQSSAGPLVLRADGAGPWLGSTCRLSFGPLPAVPLPIAWSGLSRTTWQGAPLPTSLAPLGFPNSTLWISLDGPWLATNNGRGDATVDIPIPPAAGFAGLEIFLQAATFEPISGALTTSNALHLTIGSRN